MLIQVDVSNESVKELKALMKEGNVHTYEDLLNNALTLLEWATGEVRAGRSIASLDETQLTLPIFEFGLCSCGFLVHPL